MFGSESRPIFSRYTARPQLSPVPRVGVQVLADQGKAVAVAFDEIDKAPEEKARGITIATVRKATTIALKAMGTTRMSNVPIEQKEALPFHERVILLHTRKKGIRPFHNRFPYNALPLPIDF